MKKWIVGEGDGRTVGEIVLRAGETLSAIEEGRVFVGRVRAERAEMNVQAGDEVTIAAPVRAEASIDVLYLSSEIVAANKPAGIPTIADLNGGAHALHDRLAKQLNVPKGDLHPTSRLDHDVSGVVVFARTKRAAEALQNARDKGGYKRRYIAIAKGELVVGEGEWAAPIGRAKNPKLRAIGGRDAIEARSLYRVVATCAGYTLLWLAPVTGRTHQLRVHASHAGVPLVGDTAYGGPKSISLPTGKIVEPRRILLHAARVVIKGKLAPHPLIAPIPPPFSDFWRAIGGDVADFEKAFEA